MSNQLYWLTGVIVTTVALITLHVAERGKFSNSFDSYIQSFPSQDKTPYLASPSTISYLDPDTGFEANIPESWMRISHTSVDDIGFTVSFESPASDPTDVFADYLMIDIQPARIEPVFAESPERRIAFNINSVDVLREQIVLEDYPVADTVLDLVVWQLILNEDLHSVGIYVVGEKSESEMLERVLLDFAFSFELPISPFQLSTVRPDFSVPDVQG